MLKAVLFDLDQTLIDWDAAEPWEEYQARRIRSVFDYVHSNVQPLYHTDPDSMFECYVSELITSWQRSNETLITPTITDVLASTLEACGVDRAQIDTERLVAAYDWQPPAGVRAYPDVLEVLPQLIAANLELGIITNASHPMAMRDCELQTVGLIDMFPRCRISAADVGYLKPHRRIFEHTLALLGVEPTEAVFVGDNLVADVKGAQGVGMYGVWREHGDETDATLDSIIPDGTISTFHDLLPLLDTWYPGWRA